MHVFFDECLQQDTNNQPSNDKAWILIAEYKESLICQDILAVAAVWLGTWTNTEEVMQHWSEF